MILLERSLQFRHRCMNGNSRPTPVKLSHGGTSHRIGMWAKGAFIFWLKHVLWKTIVFYLNQIDAIFNIVL